MQAIDEIFYLLRIISGINNSQISNNLIFDGSIKLFSGHNQLVEINSQQLKLCGHDVTDKLIAKTDKLDIEIDHTKFANFLSNVSTSFLRLNHIGISYAVADIELETFVIKDFMQNTNFNLFEEPSGDSKSKWLFVGDTTNWESPLFEIVLAKEINNPENIKRPHFQIDIDTNLEQGKLEKYLLDCFGKDFVQRKLDVPNYGVVLEMGMLGSMLGTKIYLGLGTNLRDTRYHREKILQKLT